MKDECKLGCLAGLLVVAIVIAVLLMLSGCQQNEASQPPVNLDPMVETAAPVAVQLFVPEPWKTLALVVLAGLGGGAVGRKTKKNE